MGAGGAALLVVGLVAVGIRSTQRGANACIASGPRGVVPRPAARTSAPPMLTTRTLAPCASTLDGHLTTRQRALGNLVVSRGVLVAWRAWG